jgi:hypothetical protein
MNAEDLIDQKLDQALEMTFPASDPFTIDFRKSSCDDERALVARESGLETAA